MVQQPEPEQDADDVEREVLPAREDVDRESVEEPEHEEQTGW